MQVSRSRIRQSRGSESTNPFSSQARELIATLRSSPFAGRATRGNGDASGVALYAALAGAAAVRSTAPSEAERDKLRDSARLLRQVLIAIEQGQLVVNSPPGLAARLRDCLTAAGKLGVGT